MTRSRRQGCAASPRARSPSGAWSCCPRAIRRAQASRSRSLLPDNPEIAVSVGHGARMTVPPIPEVAKVIFGEAALKAERYACRLAGPGVERGLIGPNEIPRIWERHLLNCAVVADLIPGSCSLIDI